MSQLETSKKRKNTKEAPQNLESSMYLVVLLVSAAFAALLFSASSRILGYEIDAPDSLKQIQTPKTSFERSLEKMVAGHPLSVMTPFLAKQDKLTASYLVAIAKHESNWGKRSPKMDGRECYNYWGYRGQTERVTKSGYSCFESPKQAVSIVGKRLEYLIWDLHLDTAEELLVWKCGASCASHNEGDVNRWARNVGFYSRKVGQSTGF